MPKGIGYKAKDLKATKVNGKKEGVRSVTTVGKLNSSPLRPAPKYNTPKQFSGYIKK